MPGNYRLILAPALYTTPTIWMPYMFTISDASIHPNQSWVKMINIQRPQNIMYMARNTVIGQIMFHHQA
jgi:hypothetical protein